jgi:hypothetical protein
MGVMAMPDEDKPVALTQEEKRRQRVRSIAIAFALATLAVIFFLVTIVRMGGNVFNRAI